MRYASFKMRLECLHLFRRSLQGAPVQDTGAMMTKTDDSDDDDDDDDDR